MTVKAGYYIRSEYENSGNLGMKSWRQRYNYRLEASYT